MNMKSIYKKLLGGSLIVMLISLLSCNLEEANVNPNSATDASINVILPTAQGNLLWAINDFSAQSASTLVQYMTGTLNVQLNITTYAYLPANFNTTWNNHFYAGAMKDLKTIIDKSTENEAFHYRGIAKIQMAMSLAYLVDLWGDVPYSEALDLIKFPTPKFDKGDAVYQEVFKLLDEGIADLQGQSSFSPTNNDLFFPQANENAWRTNSRPRWIKAANALKARYHNHYSKIDPSGSATKALEAIAAGTFLNNNEEMKVSFGASQDAAGPWFLFLQQTFGQNNISVCQTFINLLRERVAPGINDPRLPFFISPNGSGNFVGTAYGSTSNAANISLLGPYANTPGSPTNLITFAEVKFIEAEARFRLNQFAQAATAYNDAVKASILRVTGAANPAYEALFANEDATTIQVNGLQKIFTEKHIAMFLQTESWADWRRSIPANAAGTVSGIPALTAPANNATNGVFPRRFLYPNSELDNNGANIPETSLTAKVFWDR
jgi:hypothetical protein